MVSLAGFKTQPTLLWETQHENIYFGAQHYEVII